jgi:hypothetical protein
MNQRNGAARWPKGSKRGSRISDNDLFKADEIADEEQVENEESQKSEVEGSTFERDGQPHGAKTTLRIGTCRTRVKPVCAEFTAAISKLSTPARF